MNGKRTGLRTFLVLLAQIVIVTGLGALLIALGIALDRSLGTVAYDWVMWGAVPLMGLGTSWIATRLGVPYGLAWVAPPVCQVAAQWLLLGLLPSSPGMPMVTLVLSVVGAVAGEEQMRRASRGGRYKGKK